MANANGGKITYTVEVDSSGAITSIKNFENTASNTGKNAGSKLSAGWAATIGVISGITQRVFDSVVNTITSSVNSAISRIDTFNKYPQVLSNFGVSADEAAASIKRIDDSLKGLPVTLNAGVAGVQGLFFATQDLGKAEDTFKAITDAALIFTTDASMATDNFIYAYKQAMASGKILAQDFNQMNSAIPGLMDKIADSLGMNVAEMKESLADGSLSVDEFNEAFLRLDSEGGAGMNSMAETAKSATGGIETAMSLLNTTVTRVIGNIIDTIGSENIVAAINSVADVITGVGNAVMGVINFIAENQWVQDLLLSFLITLGGILLATIIPATIAWGAALLANPITWIVAGVTALIFGLIELVKHIDEVGKFFTDVFGAIGDFFKEQVDGITNWWNGLVQGFQDGIQAIGDWFHDTFQGIWDFVTGVFNGIGDFFRGIWDTIVSIFTNVGTAIGDAVSGAFKTVVNGVLSFVENFINTPMNLINGFVDIINGVFGAVGVNIGHVPTVSLPRMATGGVVEATSGGRAIIAGEAGEDEWVVPESKFASLLDALEQRSDSLGGNTYYFNGCIGTESELRAFAEQITNAQNMNNKRRLA